LIDELIDQLIMHRHFYCTMHYSAKRGIEIACHPSVCPSVCLWRWWIRTT